MSGYINAPYNTITNYDGLQLAHNSFYAPGGSIHIGGKLFEEEPLPHRT
jgi:hypothetical protein